MARLTSLLTAVLVPASLLIGTSSAIAHQHIKVGTVSATVHLEPNDSPTAGKSSLTWFHLSRSDGEAIPLSDCACSLVVYDSQNQPIAYPQLSETAIEGHERPINTSITFPSAGIYQLVFTGQSKEDEFEPFQLKVPVTVRP